MIPREEFEKLVAEEWPEAIPEKFRSKVTNVAFLVEDEPSPALRAEERLPPHVTLLGHYRGVPHTVRGDYYGVGQTLPDTITLFQIPIEDLAEQYTIQKGSTARRREDRANFQQEIRVPSEEYIVSLRQVIRETIWHEVAHHFGMNEYEVRTNEAKRK